MEQQYAQILRLANSEKAIREGQFYDLMYAQDGGFDRQHIYAFLRRAEDATLLILVNFGEVQSDVNVTIPGHAVDFLSLPTGEVQATELLTGEKRRFTLNRDEAVAVSVPALGAAVLKF